MEIKDKCSRKKCGWIGTDDEKAKVLDRKNSGGGIKVHTLVCPNCSGKTFYELNNIIKVKDGNNTYTARCNFKTATCTHSEDLAAQAVARKCWPESTVKLSKQRVPDGWLFRVDDSMMLEPEPIH